MYMLKTSRRRPRAGPPINSPTLDITTVLGLFRAAPPKIVWLLGERAVLTNPDPTGTRCKVVGLLTADAVRFVHRKGWLTQQDLPGGPVSLAGRSNLMCNPRRSMGAETE